MVNDHNRMDAYKLALEAVVTADSVVLDIGAGAGVFALLACSLGARKVYAIETNSAIEIARECARANGYADRIEFFQSNSTEIVLPEPASVIVSDLRGSLPLYGNHIGIIEDARQRFLAPGGVMIPQSDKMWAAIASAPKQFKACNEPWNENPYGLDMRPGARYVFNQIIDGPASRDSIVSKPESWATLDYRNVSNTSLSKKLCWEIDSSCEAHGISIWFDTKLFENIGYSNCPDNTETIYGQSLLPWPEAVNLHSGDKVDVALRTVKVNDDYVWSWDTEVSCGNQVLHKFIQSTLSGSLISSEQLRKKRSDFVPRLSRKGEMLRSLLLLMDTGLNLSDISEQIYGQFPGQFENIDSAFAFVADLTYRYSE